MVSRMFAENLEVGLPKGFRPLPLKWCLKGKESHAAEIVQLVSQVPIWPHAANLNLRTLDAIHRL